MRTRNLVLMRKSVSFAGTKEKDDDVNVRMYVCMSVLGLLLCQLSEGGFYRAREAFTSAPPSSVDSYCSFLLLGE